MNFDEFQRKWSGQLEDIGYTLDFLHTYPIVLKKLKLSDLISSKELINCQKEWILLYSKYDGLEKEFFKPYWIPIQRESINYFIDLSNPNYPVFETNFIFTEPYSYVRINLFDSINDFMMIEDDGIDPTKVKEQLIENHINHLIKRHYNKNT